MSRTIDIRKVDDNPIDKIRVADRSTENYIAEIINKSLNNTMCIHDTGGNGKFVNVISKEHAENLIVGLKKAIELEWVK